MSPEYQTTSVFLRGVFAVAACLATVLVTGSIYGLMVHYNADTQATSAQSTLVAQR
jgi:hypothetical protein